MAKEDLKKVLIRLFGDPDLHEQVRKNGWEGLGLSEQEIEMLTNRDSKALTEYLKEESVHLQAVGYWLPKKE
jgi:hypothetical protein